MNRTTFQIVLAFLTFIFNCDSNLYSQANFLTYLEAKEDLKVFIDAYDHHPGLFLYRSQSEIDSLKQDLVSYSPDSVSYDDFYLKLLESLVFLKDGHTGLSLGTKYSAVKRSQTTLPFRYKILNNEIFITESFSKEADELQLSKLISVNNISTDSLLNLFYRFTTSDNDNELFKQRYNEHIFGKNFDFFIGKTDKYRITGLTYKGDTLKKTIKGIEYFDSIMKANDPIPLNYSIDVNRSLAILTVNTFDYRRIVESGIDYHKFIDKFFKEVRKNNIANVAIDLRENYGGSGALAMSLYAYLAFEDFKWIDYSLTLLDGTEEFAKLTQYSNGQYPFLSTHDTTRIDTKLKVTNGLESKNILSSTLIPFGPKRKAKDISKNKYGGNLFILSSGMSFSAGSIFISKCTDRDRSVIIGEPTGSAAGIFCGGGYLRITLPNSGFQFLLPTMERHIALSNKNINPLKPLPPTYLIKSSLNDIVEGVDRELEKVYELIK